MSTIEPGLGRTAGFSTSFWKIHGWVERQAFLSRTTDDSLFIATFYAGHFSAPPCGSREIHKQPCIPAGHRHPLAMHLPIPELPLDPKAQRALDRRRLVRALNFSLGFVLLLAAVFVAQHGFDWTWLAVAPRDWAGLIGVLGAPLLHGSPEHLGANAVSLLLLGTLAGTTYPRATLRALPLLWLGSGLGAWLLGQPGTHHLGASGLTHGLMLLLLGLGLLRRDRPAIAAAMIAFFLYGGMLLTVLPHEPGVSWQAHLGGAVGGVLAAWLFRRSDPQPARRRYSWELEEEAAQAGDLAQFEPPAPTDVPVLWSRPSPSRGTILRFPDRRR
jgi:membrane associated rhomboid family serine protease